jgi:hypothetical protein
MQPSSPQHSILAECNLEDVPLESCLPMMCLVDVLVMLHCEVHKYVARQSPTDSHPDQHALTTAVFMGGPYSKITEVILLYQAGPRLTNVANHVQKCRTPTCSWESGFGEHQEATSGYGCAVDGIGKASEIHMY